ncbi:MAG: exodeoxyribonuclease III [Desulfobacterota bacterium]|nr:exodeoxyribonuclease III [Thermodesulfobacteriota bacterium]
MKLISWNVNGLRALHRKGGLGQILQMQPEIVCLQETKATIEDLPDALVAIPGYHAYFCSADRRGYSGVALYARQQPNRIVCGFGIERFDREGRTLIADYGSFLLYNVYFPNGQMSSERLAYKLDFYTCFLEHLVHVIDAGRHVILCGDLNTAHRDIDLARPKENEHRSGFLPEEREWIDALVRAGFVDTFRMFQQEGGHYTWWDLKSRARERNVGWRIDYFFVSASLSGNVQAASIFPTIMGSDHCPIGLEIDIKC